MLLRAILAAALLLAAPACARPIPESFALPPDFYPESIDVARDGTFFVGSWRQGAIARLRPGQATAEVIVPPGSNGLTNTQGVLVDRARGLLWACSGNLGYATVPRRPSALKSFDLASGRPRASYAFPGGGYCNDLALAPDGRIYVTDSFKPRVLVLDRPDAELRPWAEDPRFCLGTQGFCLNGIAIDPGRAVYVSTVEAQDALLEVPFAPTGAASPARPVRMPRVLKNADAIRFLAPDRIVIFESNAFAKNDPLDGSISLARLQPDGTAVLDTLVNGLADPSSGIVFGGRIYFIESKYEILLRHQPDDTRGVPTGVPFRVDSVPLPQ